MPHRGELGRRRERTVAPSRALERRIFARAALVMAWTRWALQGVLESCPQAAAVQQVGADGIAYRYHGVDYQLKLARDAGSCEQWDKGGIRLRPNRAGKLELRLDVTRR